MHSLTFHFKTACTTSFGWAVTGFASLYFWPSGDLVRLVQHPPSGMLLLNCAALRTKEQWGALYPWTDGQMDSKLQTTNQDKTATSCCDATLVSVFIDIVGAISIVEVRCCICLEFQARCWRVPGHPKCTVGCRRHAICWDNGLQRAFSSSATVFCKLTGYTYRSGTV